jgi:hypothetical protein
VGQFWSVDSSLLNPDLAGKAKCVLRNKSKYMPYLWGVMGLLFSKFYV